MAKSTAEVSMETSPWVALGWIIEVNSAVVGVLPAVRQPVAFIEEAHSQGHGHRQVVRFDLRAPATGAGPALNPESACDCDSLRLGPT